MKHADMKICRESLLIIPMIVWCILGMSSVVRGQDKSDQKKFDLLEPLMQEKTPAYVSQPAGIALESTVDPKKYFIGPSDVIAVSIWMSPPQNYWLTVTPEGSLIIPTVGEVLVSDMTLARAKEKILREIRRKYLTSDITATLVRPRSIIVSVVGMVLNEGLYTVNAVDRTNKAIDEANKPSRLQDPSDVKPILAGLSKRTIIVKHRDGTQDRVDLQKYFATRDDRWNPYLREGDVVVVQKRDPTKNVIAMYGEVNSSGRIEYVEGDSLTDAIAIANGLTSRALGEHALFSRLDESGREMMNREVNIPAILAGHEPNIALQPGDRLIVNAKVDVRDDYNVEIKGEVVYPGTYPITRDHTHLSEAIKEAGGFTGFASLGSAEIIRRSILPEEEKRLDVEALMFTRGGAGSGDTLGYTFESGMRVRREAVVVDFRRLFIDRDSTQDIVIQSGDQISIPARQRTVYVFGQVVSPGHIPFIEGKESGYYIEKAGGFASRASKGDVRIIKATTKQWLDPGDTELEDGDNIWVPADLDRPFGYYLNVTSQAVSVLGVLLSIAILVRYK